MLLILTEYTCSGPMKSDAIPTNTVCLSVELGLRLIGMWPGTSVLRRFLYISVMAVFQVFQYRYLIAHFSFFSEQDLSLLMDALSTTMAYSLLFFKLVVLVFNVR